MFRVLLLLLLVPPRANAERPPFCVPKGKEAPPGAEGNDPEGEEMPPRPEGNEPEGEEKTEAGD